MRRLLILSGALGILLLVMLNVQRALYQALTKRPFMGIWTEGPLGFHHGPRTYLEFERGGNLWITSFGQARWRAHWEETSRNQLIISGLDPAQPKGKETFRWFLSGRDLSLMPMPQPGTVRPMSHLQSGYTLAWHYSRARAVVWPTPERLVGVWVTRLSRFAYHGRDGQVRHMPGKRVLLDIHPGGEAWIYQDGQPRHNARWTARDDGRFSPEGMTFTLVDEDAGPKGNGEIWGGGMSYGRGRAPSLGMRLWAHQQGQGADSQPLKPENDLGQLTLVADTPPDKRPFLGAWRTRAGFPGPQFTLELFPGGLLRVTGPEQSPRRGTWKESGPWPRLTLVGMDAKQPQRETEWYWSHEGAFEVSAHGVNGEMHHITRPEALALVNPEAAETRPADGTLLEFERVPSVSPEVDQHTVEIQH